MKLHFLTPKQIEVITNRLVSLASKLIPERPFHQYQWEFAEAVVRAVLLQQSEELTALFSRQSGKTETMARINATLALWLPAMAKKIPALQCFQKGIWIGIFAPVKDQATTSFERVCEVLDSPAFLALAASMGVHPVEKNKSSRVFSNGSFIRTWSASQGSNIESKTLHIALVEEAQDVGARKISKSIEPMLASTAGNLIQIGTANTVKSLFYETIQRNKKRQRMANVQRQLHFQFDFKTIIKHNARYRSFLNAKLEQRGKQWAETDEFKMAFGCQFILSRGQFISYERFAYLETLCNNIPRGPYSKYGECLLAAPMVAGIDWGKASDSTVVTVIAKMGLYYQIVDWLQLVGDDWDSQFDSVIKFLKRFPTLKLVVAESNGVGDPMVDRLKKAFRDKTLHCQVEPFWASATSNSDGYKALMLDFVHSNNLLFPGDHAARESAEFTNFADQLTDLQKEYKGSLLKVCAPDLTSEDGEKKHDDYGSSLMIAHHAASQMTPDGMYEDFYGKKTA